MNAAPPLADARCRLHPDVVAHRTCPRCGAFMCTGCERKVRIDATPMCPACWDLREQRLPYPEPSNPLATVGLAAGVVALVAELIAMSSGLVAVAVVAVIPAGLNGLALTRPGGKARAVAGLCMTVLAAVIGAAGALAS